MPTVTLLYHDVVEAGSPHSSGFTGADADAYKLAWPEFDRHLRVLADIGRAPSLVTASYHLADEFMLTFDDGGISAQRIARALEQRGWPGHFFATVDYIGTPGFMDAARIRTLTEAGHVVGSHSCSHPLRMARQSGSQLHEEWHRSVATLSDIVGSPVITASIPGGAYSRQVAVAAAAEGIRWLFTSEPTTRVGEVDGCFVVGRYTIMAGTPAGVAKQIAEGVWLPRYKQWVWWNAKKIMKRLGGEIYLAARRKLMEGRRGGHRAADEERS